ncbi:VC0807 family protein [Streptomyces sp. WM6386]|uniref:VC0807 family protein n=1 Tax=Streptomyces sp. WM6386 TaxID=1415558 RepID=UPI000619444E|nr:VC0807 family protein [Streptomyces sp. WM6386]KKD04101.1 membrane protein [Streptomyces sp. WM6386]
MTKTSKQNTFAPLIVDVAVPVGSYYLFRDAFGMSTFAALAWSSAVPAGRTLWSVVRERTVNGLAALILVVNAVSLLLGLVSGDPRLMLAKDSGVSSIIGVGILVSVALGRPMMTAGFKPFLVRGDSAREAAWRRLADGTAEGSGAFRRAERVFSVVWGVVLLAECVARVVGAYTLPVDTMVWLGSVILAGSMTLAFVVSRVLAAEPMARLLVAEVRGAEEAVKAEVAVAA